MNNNFKILIIEDDATLAQAIQFGLEKEQYIVKYLTDGLAADRELEKNAAAYDLLILDWMLPGKTGLEICQDLRRRDSTLSVLLLTGRDGTDEKVKALEAGADDYLTKPFAFPELLARVRALSRRPKNFLANELKLRDFILDTQAKKIFHQGREILLTLKEFAILEYLMRHPNQVITREQILDHVWDYNFDSFSNIVDVHINNLRKKRNAGAGQDILETVRGVGYCVKTA